MPYNINIDNSIKDEKMFLYAFFKIIGVHRHKVII
jgi:hypothetical protein